MTVLGPSLVLYVLVGVGVAVAVYLSGGARTGGERGTMAALAVVFWPMFVPLLLTQPAWKREDRPARSAPPADAMAGAIAQVDAELEAALSSLDGWAEDVLAREQDRIHELRSAWSAQADRIREMDRLLALPEYTVPPEPEPVAGLERISERIRHSRQARLHNIERLRAIRSRAHDDLLGTLAWVRELVSMIHLAKFTGAPASRAEELVAQIAAAVEGLSAVTWQEETERG